MKTTPEDPQASSSTGKGLAMALVIAFLVAAGLTSYLTFKSVRDFVASWEMTGLPGATIREATPTPEGQMPVVDNPDTPLQPQAGPVPVPWDGASRVTLLVVGLDYRDWEAGGGPPRTDTMILLTIDPLTRTAGMLSIPRDLWVNVPGGFSYSRINAAYRLGELYDWPGGGPGLAMETVEELLGVPIDYYAQIDFGAFVKFIDEIGGVKVDVPEPITIDLIGTGSKTKKKLQPGRQNLPGEWALAYARARKTEGGDFDRAQRQQQVIMGIRERILSLEMLPTLIARSGVLYQELSGGVHTNLTLDQAVRLAWLAQQIPEENIKKGIIGPPDQVNMVLSPEGDQVLKPITDKIRLLRDDIFTNTGAASPVANMALVDLMKAENARVAILNGTTTPGLAAQTADYLKSLGVNVTATENAQKVTGYTEVTFYTGKPYTVRWLVELMKVEKIRIYHVYDPAGAVDVSVTLGEDWAASNPMP